MVITDHVSERTCQMITRKFFYKLFMFFFSIAVVMAGVLTWVYTPVVYSSATTGECIAIWTAEGLERCDKLPNRYLSSYVSPDTTFEDIRRNREQ